MSLLPSVTHASSSMSAVTVASGEYRAKLGESPVWDAASKSLVFVDIQTSEVCALDVASATVKRRRAPHGASCVVKSAKGGYLVASGVDDSRTGGRMYRVDLTLEGEEGAFGEAVGDVFAAVDELAGHVTNDGAVDPKGRLWIGTKMPRPRPAYVMDAESGAFARDDANAPTAALYCLEAAWKSSADGKLKAVGVSQRIDEVGAVTISNGIAWSPDHKTFYYVDTPTKCVKAFAFDAQTGLLSDERVFTVVGGGSDGVGAPDGVCVAEDGSVWVAVWDGHCVLRFDAQGELMETIDMPVSRPTSLAFGGDDGKTLFITSCSYDASSEVASVLEQEPLAGAIFALKTDVKGAEVFASNF